MFKHLQRSRNSDKPAEDAEDCFFAPPPKTLDANPPSPGPLPMQQHAEAEWFPGPNLHYNVNLLLRNANRETQHSTASSQVSSKQAVIQNQSEGKQENQTGLPDSLKTGIETLSGLSMDDVRVRYNSSKPAAVQALAYTQGSEIHVAPGQEKHLPHEAWHVAQQKQGRVKPTLQVNGVSVNDDPTLEREADVMGAKAEKTISRKPADGVAERGSFGAEFRQSHHSSGPGLAGASTQPTQFVKGPKKEPNPRKAAAKAKASNPPQAGKGSDVKQQYSVTKGCALQALIGYGLKPFGKSTAKELHDHIWATDNLKKYRYYDDDWKTLYKDLNIKPQTIPNDVKKVKDLSVGKYIYESRGHVAAVIVTNRGIEFKEDPANKLGKEGDEIQALYQ